jgi:hypothetical protein
MSIAQASISAAPTAASVIYTSSGNTAVTTMYICNQTASTLTMNLFAIMNGFVANNTNKIYSNTSIAANDTLILEWERIILSQGDTMSANASATGLVTTISYVSI